MKCVEQFRVMRLVIRVKDYGPSPMTEMGLSSPDTVMVLNEALPKL